MSLKDRPARPARRRPKGSQHVVSSHAAAACQKPVPVEQPVVCFDAFVWCCVLHSTVLETAVSRVTSFPERAPQALRVRQERYGI